MPEDRQVAYHEAGHAVALLALGGALASVSIAGDARARGRVRSPSFPDPSVFPIPLPGEHATERTVETPHDAMVIALLAACQAEQIATGRCDSRAAGFDRAAAARHAARREGAHTAAYLDWAQQGASALIRRHWPAVEAVAQALLDQREVSGDQARRLVAESGREDDSFGQDGRD